MPVEVYVEAGAKRVFAGALDWPGWCRSSRSEDHALEGLIAYGPRYAAVLKGSGVRFTPPAKTSTLEVVERLKGDATTDFGAPSIPPKADAGPVDRRWLTRQEKILRASWKALDRAAANVSGPLEKGPRGGGREVDAIVAHVVGAEASYARMIGASAKGFDEPDAEDRDDERGLVLDGLERAVVDGITPVRAAGSGGRPAISSDARYGTSWITRGRSRIVPQGTADPGSSAGAERRRIEPNDRCSSSSAASAS